MSATSSTPRSRPVAIAPASSPYGQQAQDASATMSYTCVTCARRKVKCDKTAPTCSTCRKARLDCVYQEPAPRKRKRKSVDDVHKRLEYCERLLKQNGILSEEDSAQDIPIENAAGSATQKAPEGELAKGKLVGHSGKARFIDSHFWNNLGDDLQASDDDDEEGQEPSPLDAHETTRFVDPVSGALLSSNSPSVILIDSHPSYESAMTLWKTYVENVDPIVKVIHVPSFLGPFQQAAADPSSASKITELLLFAVYHFAILTLSESECQKHFAEQKARLLARYHDAVRQALVNNCFLRTTDLSVLQAFVLFLLSVRGSYDPHTFWILTGIAVRIAQRIGLHRDGEELGLKPYDVQIRRRVFWQLVPLDGMAGQMCGTGICITLDSFSVKQPLNINDSDIWPGMTDPPEPRTGATDIIFCLARTESAKFVQKHNPPMGNWSRMGESTDVEETDEQIDGLENTLETKFVRYCDFVNPLHSLMMAMIRASVDIWRLRTRVNRVRALGNVSDDERKQLWILSNKVISYDIAAYSNPALAGFMWHLKAFFMFDPLLWVLNELGRDPLAYKDEDEWATLEKLFNNHPQLISGKQALQAAICRMTLRSWDAYQSCICKRTQRLEPEPSFITSIRANVHNRVASQSSSGLTPAGHYNSWNPADMTDVPQGSNIAGGEQMVPNDFDFNPMPDFNTDSMDWAFWDRLIQDPLSFSGS